MNRYGQMTQKSLKQMAGKINYKNVNLKNNANLKKLAYQQLYQAKYN